MIFLGISAMTPTPEIRLFARTAAIAMAMDFVFQITFFASTLAISARYEKQPAKADKNTTADMVGQRITLSWRINHLILRLKHWY